MSDKKLEAISKKFSTRKKPLFNVGKHFIKNIDFIDDDGSLNIPKDFSQAMFGMGCFWGAEKKFWSIDGVYLTCVGYTGGVVPYPSYEEVCSGLTGHNEVVNIIFDPSIISYEKLLSIFWESHNPTQGMRQGNDIGTQYRSGIYVYEDQLNKAKFSKDRYQNLLLKNGFGTITTEILDAENFYFAEPYHQQYLAKNPNGYCGLGGLNIPYK